MVRIHGPTHKTFQVRPVWTDLQSKKFLDTPYESWMWCRTIANLSSMRPQIKTEIRLENSPYGDAQRRALSTENVWTGYFRILELIKMVF